MTINPNKQYSARLQTSLRDITIQPDRTAAECMRRMRARQAEEAERAAAWAVHLAERLARDHPEAARVLADVPAHVAGLVVEELNRRAFERAVQRAQG